MFLRKVILFGALSLMTMLFGSSVVGGPATAQANDWTQSPSIYSHNPETGERVAQYAQPQPAFVYENPTYMKSGYHHRRMTLRNGDGSLDQFHVVEEWGRPVRPYGEWERPFRPYSVPYQLWGEPYGGLGPIYQNYPYPVPYANPGGGYGNRPGYGNGPGHGPGPGYGNGPGRGPYNY
ncbi:hypothetical protein [Blastopirellula marina]|nr:hypothetical protein [Blastopirellula marina]